MEDASTTTSKHPEWPAKGEHLWGPWFPQDKRHVYRRCAHPKCQAIETKEV